MRSSSFSVVGPGTGERAYLPAPGVKSGPTRKFREKAECDSARLEARLQSRVHAELIEVSELELERLVRAGLRVGAAGALVAGHVRVVAVEALEPGRVAPAERHLGRALARELRGGILTGRQDRDDRVDVVVADDGGRRAGRGRAGDARRRGQRRGLLDDGDQAERQKVVPVLVGANGG